MPINIAGTQLPARAWVPPSALLAECFAGALRLRRATGACLECREPLERSACPVARRNESCEARANEAPAKAASSRLDQASVNGHISVPRSALLAECFAGALRLRRATGALPCILWRRGTHDAQFWHHVARRNESCEARANEAPAKAAGSRLDDAAVSDHNWVPPSALLAECFAGALRLRRATGACLRCRKTYQHWAIAHTRSAA